MRSWTAAALGLLMLARVHAADCPDPLFTCETDHAGKFISICATEIVPGHRWTDIQYRFGPGDGPPELVFPKDPATGAKSLFFSHEERGSDYRVTVRFSTGGYVYRVFSHSGEERAGVTVADRRGTVLSTVKCIERPYMFPSYLQRALACDLENPHGKAACADRPFRARR